MAKGGKAGATQVVAKFPEVGTFKEIKGLKKHYKGLTDAELEEWIAKEGLTFNACPTSQPINRMRMCMAILYKHFPDEQPKPKAKSKYQDLTLEQLVEMAATNDVPVEMVENEKILRMRLIMALRAHKIIS